MFAAQIRVSVPDFVHRKAGLRQGSPASFNLSCTAKGFARSNCRRFVSKADAEHLQFSIAARATSAHQSCPPRFAGKKPIQFFFCNNAVLTYLCFHDILAHKTISPRHDTKSSYAMFQYLTRSS